MQSSWNIDVNAFHCNSRSNNFRIAVPSLRNRDVMSHFILISWLPCVKNSFYGGHDKTQNMSRVKPMICWGPLNVTWIFEWQVKVYQIYLIKGTIGSTYLPRSIIGIFWRWNIMTLDSAERKIHIYSIRIYNPIP